MIQDVEKMAYWALQKMDMYSKDALHMIMRTGMAETGFRKLIQMGGGPALGFFQVEPKTIMDTIDNYVKYCIFFFWNFNIWLSFFSINIIRLG